MSSQLVSLAWDGHHRTLVSVLEKLLVNSHFVDCTIAAEGQKLKAHREILSAFSPFLELLFREETEHNPTVIISGISFRDLRSLVHFMYRGQLEVSEDRIRDLIHAAECLYIEGLGGVHKEDDSENIKDSTGKSENEFASVDFKKSEMKNLNYSNEIGLENSVISCDANSSVQYMIPNSDVQNVGILTNISLMPVQSTWSEIEMGSINLQDEYVMKKKPGSDGDENINEPLREPRRITHETSSIMHVVGNSENSYENSGEETSVGLPADISVSSVNYEDLPLDCVPPAVLSSQLCSRDLAVSVKTVLSNFHVKPSSESVGLVETAEETQDPLFQSELDMNIEDETLSADNDLISENEELSENLPESIGINTVSDMQVKRICPEQRNVSRAAFVKHQRIDEPAVGLMPGLPAEVNPHVTPSPLSHTTPIGDGDLPGATGTDVRNGGSADMFRCPICNTTFTHRGALYGHMRIHSKERQLRYGECNNGSVTSIALNKHPQNESERQLNKSTVCDFKSVNPSALSVHMRIHKGLESYKCTECEYTSGNSFRMKLHQQIHSRVRPYKCTECDYSGFEIGNLKSHQRIHSGVKPYECPECDYRSVRHTDLKMHQRIHSGIKPYKCTECDYRVAQIGNLKRHQQIHH